MIHFRIVFIFMFFLHINIFPLTKKVFSESSFLKTETIRKNLFRRMDDRKKSSTLRKVNENILFGIFSRVTDSESVWVRIESRTDFRKWTFKLSKKNLNLPRQEVRVWLKYVSPKLSVSHGKEYNDWFRKKSAFELQKIFYNRKLRINYDYSESMFRLDGMVWTGDTNLNIWLVKNGWSFYLLEDDLPSEHEDFLAAENEAKKEKIGLWKSELQ
tara:strand:+ start:277 stop:918 length:642 start_codon:yes stop_codon:yes gene_type:complete